MGSKKSLLGLCVLFLVSFAILFFGTFVYSSDGVIKYPSYKTQEVIYTTQDMMYDLGWRTMADRGRTNGVAKYIFSADDPSVKAITFEFDMNMVASSVLVSVEEGSRYTVEEITNELGQRLGESTGSTPLPVDETSAYYTP